MEFKSQDLRLNTENGSSFFQIERIVELAGDKSSGQRTDPEDAVIGPVGGRQRGPERACRVQRRTGKGPRDEHAERNRQTAAEAGDPAGRAFFIDGGGKNNENQEERCHCLKSHRSPARKIAREFRRTSATLRQVS